MEQDQASDGLVADILCDKSANAPQVTYMIIANPVKRTDMITYIKGRIRDALVFQGRGNGNM